MAIMFAILFPQYQLNLRITLIFLTLEMINFLLYPLYKIKTRYLQIEYSPIKTTTNKIISNIGRLGFSFLKTPYCTGF
jgi:hypothetical protein